MAPTMRFLWLGLPLLVVAGCTAVQDDEAGSSADRISEDGKKDDVSVAYGPCAASRAAILASVSPARAAAISRGFEWLDADVPFSMRATHESYRTDCSGFVSMCWQLPSPGQSTRDFGKRTGSHELGSYDDLVPADALVRAGQHAVIFLGWNDTSKTGACVLEQSSTKNDMQFRVRLTASLRGDGFLPVRADTFRNDTTYRPTASSSSTGTGTGGADLPGPSGDETKTDEPASPVCTSRSAATICAEAKRARSVQCGRVADDCGRPVDCNAVPGFGCVSNETCKANVCTSACTPRSAIDVCLTGRLAQGVECGKLSDGCGGTIDCDTLPMFGCGTGQTCGATAPNRCPAPPPSATPDAGAPTTPTPAPPETQGDPGDENEPMTPSSRTGSDRDDEEEADKPAKKSAPVASSGCSTAPGRDVVGGGPMALLAFAAVVALRRGRRRDAR